MLEQLTEDGLNPENASKTNNQLNTSKDEADSSTENTNKKSDKSSNKYMIWGFGLGLLSIFLGGTIRFVAYGDYSN